MRPIILSILLLMWTQEDTAAQQEKITSRWQSLAPIPDEIGFAGSFGGVSHGSLIVAGGANFPDGGAPWTGSVKKWTNKIFVLDKANKGWQVAGTLPMALGYGGSISFREQHILLGGSNEEGHSAQVLTLEWCRGQLQIRRLPELPAPIANTTAVLLNNHVYVVGGIQTADAQQAERNFWRLDLEQPQKGWEVLPPWPGPARMLSVVGVLAGKLYLFSGVELVNGQRRYLEDAYSYDPKTGWQQIASLPAPVAAAPSPALPEDNRLLVVGGDDGKLASKAASLQKEHPGFSNKIWAYRPDRNLWSLAGQVDTLQGPDRLNKPNLGVWSPVTTTAVHWNGYYVLPGGEIRPATRTNRVLVYKVIK